MGEVIAMAGWHQQKGKSIQEAPALACPECSTEVAAINVLADSTTTYRCAGHGHRSVTWRIDPEGNMLRGAVGRRYY